ncbi:MAG: YoaK family protein, partial [[Clostridium] nexile]
MKRSRQMSESIRLGIILALSGGFMDAYSYMCRGKVFANAQTGNILLFGIYMSERQWDMAIRYLIPVIAFVTGIGVADLVRMKMKEKSIFHWRQLSVLSEAVVLLVV